jgi:hypothetical protein
MTEHRYLFPRLPRSHAEDILTDLKDAPPSQLRAVAAARHDAAAPVPTGGTPAPIEILEKLAAQMRAEFDQEFPQPLTRAQSADIDARIGRVLHEAMPIVPADAAHEGVWSFVTLVLLPDIAVWRFPDRHPTRMTGRPRNVFRRPWERRAVLGDLMDAGVTLGEDELVGIFERTHLARSHRLVRVLVEHLSQVRVPDRSQYARDLMKRVRRTMGCVNVDVLSSGHLRELVDEHGRQVRNVLRFG